MVNKLFFQKYLITFIAVFAIFNSISTAHAELVRYDFESTLLYASIGADPDAVGFGYVIIDDELISNPNLGGMTGVVEFNFGVTGGTFGSRLFSVEDLADFYCICGDTPTTSDLTFSSSPYLGVTATKHIVYLDRMSISDNSTVTQKYKNRITRISLVNRTRPLAQDDPNIDIIDSADSIAIDVLANDIDSDGSLVPDSIKVVTAPINGTATANPSTGEITYTHSGSITTTDSFTYNVENNEGVVSNIATVNLMIRPIGTSCNKSVSLDGNDWINITDLPLHTTGYSQQLNAGNSSGNFTIEAWVKLAPGIDAFDSLLGQEGTGLDINFYQQKMRLFTSQDSGDAVTSNTLVQPNRWTHVAITRKEYVLSLYINGRLDATGYWSGPVPVKALGRGNRSLVENFTGEMDEVRIWFLARTPDEIASNYNKSVNSSNSLLQYLTFNGTGQTVINSAQSSIWSNFEGDGSLGAGTDVANDDPTRQLSTAPLLDNCFPVQPPVANKDVLGPLDRGQTITINILANDNDTDGSLNLESVEINTTPTNGTVTVDQITGQISYTHDGSATTSDSFTYTVEDNEGAVSNPATVFIGITPNQAPVAVNDTAGSIESSGTTTINVLDNDSDDGTLDLGSVVIETAPANGTASIDPVTGQITYSHDGSATIYDSFTYTVTDSEGIVSNVAIVTISNIDIDIDKLIASDGNVLDYFGYSVSISGDTAVIGALRDDDNGDSSGSAYIFVRDNNGNWNQQAKLVANDGNERDYFGVSVSISEETIVIGASHDGNNGSHSGSAYIFTRDNSNNWNQQAKLVANDINAVEFGRSVSISGNTMVIGAHYSRDNGSNSGSAYVFERDSNGNWNKQAKLLANDGNKNERFGLSVSISEETIIIGAHQDDDNGVDSGSAYVFVRDSNGNWSQQAKLLANDGSTFDKFGSSVSISGETVAIKSQDTSASFGATYVFTRDSSGNWNQQAKLVANDGSSGDYFGTTSISGNIMIIGSWGDDDQGTDSGSAYLFIRDSSGNWNQQGKLFADDGGAYNYFGRSVLVVGKTAIIGGNEKSYIFDLTRFLPNIAPVANDDTVGSVEAGDTINFSVTENDVDNDGNLDPASVTIIATPSNGTATVNADGTLTYESTGTTETTDMLTYTVADSEGFISNVATVSISVTEPSLTYEAINKILANDGSENDHFGYSVSISGDIAIVGSPYDDDNSVNSGSAYVITRDSNGEWSQQAKLVSEDGNTSDNFGYSVSISGYTVLIGSKNDDDNGNQSGSVYVFVRDDNGNWSQQAKLVSEDGNTGDYFGYSVSISEETALIGAYGDDDSGNSSGSAYIFVRDNSGDWSQQAKLVADDGSEQDHFSQSVSISGDTALISADSDDDNGNSSGSAYVFVRDNGNWSLQAKLLADDGSAGDRFGISASISEDTAVIGSYGDDDNGDYSGSAYVFIRGNNGLWSQQAKLLPNDGSSGNGFGMSASVSGNTVVIGGFYPDENPFSNTAYAFVRDNNGLWSQQAKLVSGESSQEVLFGASVSISGGRAIIGSLYDDGNGAAYVFDILGYPDNLPPVVEKDTATVQTGESVTIDVLANDSDSDGTLDKNSLLIVSDPSFGTVNIDFTTGAITYTHDSSATTTDTFTYTVKDNQGAVSGEGATVTISITQDPVASCGRGIEFDGANDWINIPNLSLANDFTVEGWVKLAPGIDNRDALFGQEGRGPDINFYAGKVRLFAAGDKVTANTALLPNTWEHIAITRSGTNLVLYINGVQDATGTWNGTLSLKAIGRGNRGYLKGELDEIRVWDIARTEAEISSSYDTTVDVNSAGLIGYWGLNDTDQIITDASNSGNHGSLGTSTAAGSDDPVRLDSTAPINENCGDSDPVPPVANDDVIDPIEIGETVSFSVTDNDDDADNNIDLSSVEIVLAPNAGEATVNTDGTITYQHTGSIAITDTLTYTVKNTEGLISNEATVTITVTVTEPIVIIVPPTVNDDTASVEAGGTINFNVTENDSDADGNLSPTSVVIKTFPINGVATVNPSGTITYSSNNGTIATEDTLTYTVADTTGLVSSEATVTISITQAPDVASCGKGIEFDGANDWINIPNLSLANDFTVEGWVKLAPGIDNRDALFGQEGRGPDINFYAGKVRLFAAGDKVTANTALLPNTWEHIAITRTGTNLVLYINGVADATGTWNGTLSLKAIGRGNQGYLKGELDEIRVWDIARTEAEISSSYDTAVDINSAGLIGYWGLNDTDQIITDASNSGNHGSLGTSTAAGSDDPVRLDSTAPINENCGDSDPVPPVANDDVIDPIEIGETVSFSVTDNDEDADNNIDLSSVEIVLAPNAGDATVNTDGTITYQHTGSIAITDTLTYTVKNTEGLISNEATVTITITQTELDNLPPVVVEDTAIVQAGEVVTIDVLVNDSDSDGELDKSTLLIVNSPSTGTIEIDAEGIITYSHDGTASTTDSFSYTVADNLGDVSSEATVTVSITQDPDVASCGKGMEFDGANDWINIPNLSLANDFTVEGWVKLAPGIDNRDALFGQEGRGPDINFYAGKVRLFAAGDKVTANTALLPNTWEHIAITRSGTNLVLYINGVQDATGTWNGTLSLKAIGRGNRGYLKGELDEIRVWDIARTEAEISSSYDTTVDVNSAGLIGYWGLNDTDQIITDASNSGNHGSLGVSTAAGSDDPVRLDSTAPINENCGDSDPVPPVANDDEIDPIEIRETISFSVTDNDEDADNNLDLSSVEIVSIPTTGEATVNTDGTITYQHTGSIAITDTLTYTVKNSEGLISNEAFVTITVTGPINVPPTANDDTVLVEAGGTINFNVTENDVDIDGNMNPASVSILSSPSEGTTTVDAMGKITYTSTGTVAITDAFSYTVADTQGAISNEATVTITVTGSTAVTFEVMQTLLFDEDKPSNEDFLNNYNMKHLPELGRGQKSYWDIDGGENPFYDPPNELRVKELVGTATASTVFMDLEHLPTNFRDAWDHDGDHTTPTISITDADRDRAIAEMSDIADWVHEADSDLTIGYYGVIPQRDYWSFVDPNRSEELAELQLRNEKFAALAEHVDVLFPSLYTFYNQPENWKVYAKGMIAEAKKYNKPVYAFIWPQYHSGSLGGTFIDGVYWRMQLEELYALGIDGVVIWGGYLQQWDVSALDDDPDNWWYQTLDFMHSKGLLPANTSWSPVN